MAAPTTTILRQPTRPDEFGIEVRFSPGSQDPSRIFRTITALIDTFQHIDGLLASSISPGMRPQILLEDIEAGSIRVWLRTLLESVPDDALRSGDWKPILGAFLVKAKGSIIDWTKDRNEISSRSEIVELQQVLLAAAEGTDVLHIPTYAPIPLADVAKAIELISDSMRALDETDSVLYLSSDPAIPFNQTLQIVPGSLTDLLVHEEVEHEHPMILMIKRPDLLGDAKWDFRHDRHPIEAKIQDLGWLVSFKSGAIPIHPGDALRCHVRTLVRYGSDGKVVDTKYEIIKVDAVIHQTQNSQSEFDDFPARRSDKAQSGNA
jgi:hypothetical protein